MLRAMDELLGAPSRTWKNERATLASWSPVRCVYVSRIVGHLDEDVATQVVKGGNDVIDRGGKLAGFQEWSGITSYDSPALKKLTDWGLEVRNDVVRVHIHVTDKIVRMGVSVASMVLSGMFVVHDEQTVFEQLLREEIETRRALRATGSFSKA